MAVELAFSKNSKDVLVEFGDRRITEKSVVTYTHGEVYTPQRGDRSWLKDVVEGIQDATQAEVTIVIRPRTIKITTPRPVSDLDRTKFENAIKAALQKHSLPVRVGQ